MFLMSTFEKANQKLIFFVSTFLDYYNIMNAFSDFVVKSVYAHQKFAVKNVDKIPKFIAFFAIRWYTIFAV